ncbi:MAG: hypothetical protein HYZ34_08060, partial [Ignavibacteriae bacterium]|nr:hypothetical protein [Ignavibacteriota bacterium]
MAQLNINRTRTHLQNFDFQSLFIEELGWSNPAKKKSITLEIKEKKFKATHIAQLAGVVVMEILFGEGEIPNTKERAVLHKEISKIHHEN